MADNCPADPGECWGLLGEAMPATARLSGIPSAVSSNMAKSYDLTMIQTQRLKPLWKLGPSLPYLINIWDMKPCDL